MKKVRLADFDILEFGNDRQLAGCVYSGKGQAIVVVLPDEDDDTVNFLGAAGADSSCVMMQPSATEWETLLRQTDLLNVAVGPTKAIIRKTQRQIDANMAWTVFRRDGFKCRYCGSEKPLTVDHVDLWEDGGATIVENLISSCRDCNKTRGNRHYAEWIESNDYKRRSARLKSEAKEANNAVLNTLRDLVTKRVVKQRSR